MTRDDSENSDSLRLLPIVSAVVGLVTLPVAYVDHSNMISGGLGWEVTKHLHQKSQLMFIFEALPNTKPEIQSVISIHPLVDPAIEVPLVLFLLALFLLILVIDGVILPLVFAILSTVGLLYYFTLPFQILYGLVRAARLGWERYRRPSQPE